MKYLVEGSLSICLHSSTFYSTLKRNIGNEIHKHQSLLTFLMFLQFYFLTLRRTYEKNNLYLHERDKVLKVAKSLYYYFITIGSMLIILWGSRTLWGSEYNLSSIIL